MADVINAEIRVWDEFSDDEDILQVHAMGEFGDEALELVLIELMRESEELQFTVFKALNKCLMGKS